MEVSARRSEELDEWEVALQRLVDRLGGEYSEGRPKTRKEFLTRMREIDTDGSHEVGCSACRELYSVKLDNLTEGYCVGCAVELFYSDITRAVSEIMVMNYLKARRQQVARNAQVYRQRMKLSITG